MASNIFKCIPKKKKKIFWKEDNIQKNGKSVLKRKVFLVEMHIQNIESSKRCRKNYST